MSETALLRIHCSRPLLERLDQFVAEVRAAVGRKVSRAAVIRALVILHLGELTPKLVSAIAADAVKRGRPTAKRGA